ncbi:hypothetical protein [Streptomyces sp. CC228A]|uniref:hypothetical protein n=1 Tax=Streptomyces sp. CC228A TaxID=2898186 RepID=UPI0022A87CAE|nr:hypothetical protein [Streptomyces sp. CC228A]
MWRWGADSRAPLGGRGGTDRRPRLRLPESTASAEPAEAPPSLPSYTGRSVGEAVAAAEQRGLDHAVYLARSGATVASPGKEASRYGSGEKVCRQLLDTDGLNADFDVAFLVAADGHDCAGAPLPPPAPAPESTRSADPAPLSAGGSGSTECGPILSNAGNCYKAGQYCRKADVGRSTVAANGRTTHCRYLSTDPDRPHWKY